MRRHSLLSLLRRAFTLVELIIVIIIVGILAAISIVGYQSVVDRVDQAAAETTLQAVDREYRALAAFNIAADSTAGVLIADMTAIDGIDYTAGDTDSDGLLEPGETVSFDGVVLTLSAATTTGSISGAAGTGADPPAPAPAPDEVELLLVAGGGGGGEAAWWGGGGGGGAGGMIEVASVSISAGSSYTVTVGQGGEGGTSWGAPGEDSVFASYTAIGGGLGAQGGGQPWAPATGGNGGSGGGSSSGGSYSSGTAGQGNRGGVGDNAGNYTGGGGGGAGGVGLDAPNTSTGGAGGPGKSNSITGSPVTYASGGNGGSTSGTAIDGAANSGNGGGGGPATPGGWLEGGDGGSGVAIIRFDGTKGIPTISAGLTYAITSDNGDHVIQFTAGTGTITW